MDDQANARQGLPAALDGREAADVDALFEIAARAQAIGVDSAAPLAVRRDGAWIQRTVEQMLRDREPDR